MAVFTVTRTKATLTPGSDFLTITASSTKPLSVVLIDVKGMGTSSDDNEILIQYSTSGTTAGGAITPQDISGGGAVAGFTVATTWAVQPSLSGSPLWRLAPNANGGIDKFVAMPGFDIYVPAGSKLSIRPATGSTSDVVMNVQVEER